jgi:hypothetical protein
MADTRPKDASGSRGIERGENFSGKALDLDPGEKALVCALRPGSRKKALVWA